MTVNKDDNQLYNDNKTLKNKTASGFIWKICERMAAQIVSFAVAVVLARILMPNDYAPITILAVFIAVANIFISDGLCAGLIQKRDIDGLDYSSVLLGGFVFSILIYFLIFLIAPVISGFYEMPILEPTLRVLALRIPLAAINSVEIAYLSRQMRFRSFFFGTIIGTGISAIVGISCALHGLGAWSLVAQNLSNYTIDTIVLGLLIHRIPKLRFSLKRVKPLIQYGYKILLTNMLFTLEAQFRILVIGKKFTETDVSFYSKGHQFPQLVSTVLTGPMTSVLFPTMSAVNDSIVQVKRVFRRSVQVLSYVISPVLMGIAGISGNLIPFLLTEKWIGCVPFVQIFCFYYLFPPVQSLNLEAVKAIGRSDALLKYGIIQRILSLVALIVAVFFNVHIIAISAVIGTILASIVNAYQNKQLFEYKYREQIKDWAPNLIISIIMFGIVCSIGNLLHFHHVLNMCIQIVMGIIAYIGLSWATQNPSFLYILEYLNELLHRKI